MPEASQGPLHDTLPHQHGRHPHGIQPGGAAACQHMVGTVNAQFNAHAGSQLAVQGIGHGQNLHGPPAGPRTQPAGGIPAGTAYNQRGVLQLVRPPSGFLHGLAGQKKGQLGRRAVPAAAQHAPLRNPAAADITPGMPRTPQLLQRLQHLESLPDAADMSLRAQPECGSQAKPANPRFRTAVPLRNHDPGKVPLRRPGNKPRIRRE